MKMFMLVVAAAGAELARAQQPQGTPPPQPQGTPPALPAGTPPPQVDGDACFDVDADACAIFADVETCATLYCADCDHPNYCDMTCGVCGDMTPPSGNLVTGNPGGGPAGTPPVLECIDIDADACSTFADVATCETLYCDDCEHPNLCDKTCGFCGDQTPPADNDVTFAHDGTPPNGTPPVFETPAAKECIDIDEEICSQFANTQTCAELYCEECDHPNYCDKSCGICGSATPPLPPINTDVTAPAKLTPVGGFTGKGGAGAYTKPPIAVKPTAFPGAPTGTPPYFKWIDQETTGLCSWWNCAEAGPVP